MKEYFHVKTTALMHNNIHQMMQVAEYYLNIVQIKGGLLLSAVSFIIYFYLLQSLHSIFIFHCTARCIFYKAFYFYNVTLQHHLFIFHVYLSVCVCPLCMPKTTVNCPSKINKVIQFCINALIVNAMIFEDVLLKFS